MSCAIKVIFSAHIVQVFDEWFRQGCERFDGMSPTQRNTQKSIIFSNGEY